MFFRAKVIVTAVILLLLAAGCASSQSLQVPTETTINLARATNTAAPSPSSTQIPATDTPIPHTNTPEPPTETPLPTATPDVPFEEVTFTTEDGIEIAATLFGEGDTALLMLHMGKDRADQESWHPFARLAAEQGFAALTLDLRGRGESGGEMHPPKMILDARAGAEFLRQWNFERLACLGASMGGTTCLRLALDGDLVGVVVISSTQSVGGENGVSAPDLRALMIPKLYVYGERDAIIPGEMELMFRNSAEPKQLITYDHAAHGTDLLLSAYGDDLRQQLLGFIDELR
jgi:alpha-beta hydrolase superfamily lysophospholipase